METAQIQVDSRSGDRCPAWAACTTISPGPLYVATSAISPAMAADIEKSARILANIVFLSGKARPRGRQAMTAPGQSRPCLLGVEASDSTPDSTTWRRHPQHDSEFL